ncbi:nicotinate-nucleotide--dimethylbenzimidazole phosphoribosyltransferase [Aliivibrio kagoshimensis]|uniref:nicotinate-nucleotide--dimethylbenzimidazole phosphoribosyltransferase n=1 Tax=Aliivibrio kagoshimensis TaxID=2910230 RepID=UPI003D09B6E0
MSISKLDLRFESQIQHRIDQKTKPVGALGQLELLAKKLALLQSQNAESPIEKITINKPTAVVFAADHGIAEQGVSIAPSAVTRQMVLNFIQGGAAINCFCKVNNIALKVVDAGIIEPIEGSYPSFESRRLGAGTHNLAQQAAMSPDQVELGLKHGSEVVEELVEQGCNLLILGEMGIGNTSSASAMLAAFTHEELSICVGSGTGITDEQKARKVELIDRALQRFDSQDAKTVLSEVGGFEIVQMTGAILAAAKAGIAVLVDGFIVTTAALAACHVEPAVRDYLIFSHQSEEAGHKLLLADLQGLPLLNLELRLGEGTGAALALPLLHAAACFYNEMASFESAGVTV